MTTTDETHDDADATAGTTDRSSTEAGAGPTTETTGKIQTYLLNAAFVLLGILAAIALFRLYFSLSGAIQVWVSSEFEPVVEAAFNLVVLLLSILCIVVIAREFSD